MPENRCDESEELENGVTVRECIEQGSMGIHTHLCRHVTSIYSEGGRTKRGRQIV